MVCKELCDKRSSLRINFKHRAMRRMVYIPIAKRTGTTEESAIQASSEASLPYSAKVGSCVVWVKVVHNLMLLRESGGLELPTILVLQVAFAESF